MSRDGAIEFLRNHQPMPDDDAVTNADLERLDLVLRFLTEHPDDEALELLLGVFGEGSGFGVYQLVGSAVAAHRRPAVVSALVSKLEHGSRSVRYWCANIAAYYPDELLVPGLSAALAQEDFDLRYASFTALEAVGSDAARSALRSWLPRETDDELRDLIREACEEK